MCTQKRLAIQRKPLLFESMCYRAYRSRSFNKVASVAGSRRLSKTATISILSSVMVYTIRSWRVCKALYLRRAFSYSLQRRPISGKTAKRLVSSTTLATVCSAVSRPKVNATRRAISRRSSSAAASHSTFISQPLRGRRSLPAARYASRHARKHPYDAPTREVRGQQQSLSA